ncbi:hypothetical protein Bca101_001132 [Brassica carinata]
MMLKIPLILTPNCHMVCPIPVGCWSIRLSTTCSARVRSLQVRTAHTLESMASTLHFMTRTAMNTTITRTLSILTTTSAEVLRSETNLRGYRIFFPKSKTPCYTMFFLF